MILSTIAVETFRSKEGFVLIWSKQSVYLFTASSLNSSLICTYRHIHIVPLPFRVLRWFNFSNTTRPDLKNYIRSCSSNQSFCSTTTVKLLYQKYIFYTTYKEKQRAAVQLIRTLNPHPSADRVELQDSTSLVFHCFFLLRYFCQLSAFESGLSAT